MHNPSLIASRTALLLGASLLGMLASPAIAQDVPASSDATVAGSTEPAIDAKEVVVTGSRIRGVSSVGQAVVGVSREDIRLSGKTSVADILREVPQVVNLGSDDAHRGVQGAQANTSFASGINIRGIGPNATLTLINGRRFPTSGGSTQVVDPSVVPTIALERLEVVADGSSAVYGSDAVAGVANLITRKSFDGVELRGTYGFADGYDRSNIALMVGKTWGTGNALIAIERNTHSDLVGTARDYHYGDLRPFGGSDYSTTLCNPGTLVVGGRNYAIPATAAPTAASLGAAGTVNRCDTYRGINLLPKQKRVSLLGTASQKLVGSLELFTENYFSRRNFAQQGYNLTPQTTVSVTVPNTNAFFITPVPATSVVVNYMMPASFGDAINDGFAKSYETVWGLRFGLFGGWRGSAYGSYGATQNKVYTRNLVDATRLATAIASSDPNAALDVFGTRTSQATYDFVRGYQVAITNNALRTFALQMDGPLFAMPGGDVRLALGAESRLETFNQQSLRFPTPQASNYVEDRRTVKSAYAELFVPIFGVENATAGFQRLNLSLAGRYDDYSDVGNTFNPKIGLSWQPISDVTLRGSYGTSFRAPTLVESDPSGSIVQRSLTDPSSPTNSSIGLLISGGNPTLSPEKSTSWSFGADYGREAAGGFWASLTYFDVFYENQVFDLFGAQASVLQNEAIYRAYITRSPTLAQINAVTNAGYRVTGTINPATITFILDGRRQNLGITKARGFDFRAGYGIETGLGRFDLATDGTLFTKFDIAQAPGAPVRDVLNLIDNSPKFRARFHAAWRNERATVRLTLNHLNGYTNNLVTPSQHVAAYDTFDLRASYNLGSTNPLTLSASIDNMFDRDPPFVNIAGGFDPQNASALGRVISFSVSKAF